MSKHDDDFGAGAAAMLSRTAPTPVRSIGKVAIVAKPASMVRAPSPVAAAQRASMLVRSAPSPTIAAARKASAMVSPSASASKTGPAMMGPARPGPVAKEASIAAAATAAAVSTTAALTGGLAMPPDASQQANPQVGEGGGSTAEPEQAAETQSEPEWTPPTATTMMLKAPAPVAPPAAAKESFWSKLLALFGFGKKKAEVAIHGEGVDLRSMTASVVRRARNGDQNAMALMALIRENAQKGHPRAVETFEHLKEYVRCNPIDSNPRIGVDPQLGYEPDYVALTQAPGTRWSGDSTYPDAVALSHGPKLLNPRIGEFLSQFGGEEKAAVAFGIQHKGAASEKHEDGSLSRAIRMGKIVGQARSIQAVREPGSSITAFDRDAGWELEGEK